MVLLQNKCYKTLCFCIRNSVFSGRGFKKQKFLMISGAIHQELNQKYTNQIFNSCCYLNNRPTLLLFCSIIKNQLNEVIFLAGNSQLSHY